jgi:hypothetical protein
MFFLPEWMFFLPEAVPRSLSLLALILVASVTTDGAPAAGFAAHENSATPRYGIK